MLLLKPRLRVLLVCTENTCRSPLAEAMLRLRLREMGLGREVRVASAGTRVTSPGRRPDPRVLARIAEAGARARGLRARQVTAETLERTDLAVGMEREHLRALRGLLPSGHPLPLRLLLVSAGGEGLEVPDPYYGSREAFREICERVEAGVAELATELERRLRSGRQVQS